jgi:hypothetical protein
MRKTYIYIGTLFLILFYYYIFLTYYSYYKYLSQTLNRRWVAMTIEEIIERQFRIGKIKLEEPLEEWEEEE